MKEKRTQKMLKVMEKLIEYGREFQYEPNSLEFTMQTQNDDISPVELFFYKDGSVMLNYKNLTEEQFEEWFNEVL